MVVQQIGVFQSSLIFVPLFFSILVSTLCHLSPFLFSVLQGLSLLCSLPQLISPLSLILLPFYPLLNFSVLISFLFGYCGPDLRQEMCEFKDLFFQRNCRKSNLLSNNIDLTIFGPLRLEIRAINQDSIWSAGSSGLIQSLFFDSLFGLRNSKTELYTLHMCCRPSSQIFENGDEHLELSCIASFATHNKSMFGFTIGFWLLSNLVFESTLIFHEVNNSKKRSKIFQNQA